MNWMDKLKQYAPDIATAVITGGATLPALAVKAVSDAMGVDIKDNSQLATVINGATPEQMLEVTKANNMFVLEKMRMEYQDKQASHHETQETIRSGDNASDERIRWVRPQMAKQSWVATVAYCIGCFGVQALNGDNLFSFDIAAIMAAPAYSYLGLRQIGKGIDSFTGRTTQK